MYNNEELTFVLFKLTAIMLLLNDKMPMVTHFFKLLFHYNSTLRNQDHS